MTDARLGRGRILKRRERARSGRGGLARGDRRGIREDGRPDQFRGAPRGGFIRGLRVHELPLGRRAFVLLGLGRAHLRGSRALRLQLRNLILLVGPRGDVAAQAAAAPHRRSRHPARLGALRRLRIRAARRGSCRSSGDARGSALDRPPAPVRVGSSRRAPDLASCLEWLEARGAPDRVSVSFRTRAPRDGHSTRRERRGDPVRHLSSDALSCPSRASSPSACLSRCVVPSRAPPRRDFTSRHPRVNCRYGHLRQGVQPGAEDGV